MSAPRCLHGCDEPFPCPVHDKDDARALRRLLERIEQTVREAMWERRRDP